LVPDVYHSSPTSSGRSCQQGPAGSVRRRKAIIVHTALHACAAASHCPIVTSKGGMEEKEDFFVKLKLGITFALNPKFTALQNFKCRIITGASSH